MYREENPGTGQQDRPILGLPVNIDLLFVDKNGNYSRRTEKKRVKLLEKVRFLERFLDPGEKIVFVTTACSPFGDQERRAHAGSYLLTVKRCVLVFTSRRIFHVLTTPKYEYRASIAQILYADCRSLRAEGTSLLAEYRTGKTEAFQCIPKGDAALIGRVDTGACELSGGSGPPERNHLCPSCTRVLEPDTVICPSCGIEFKSREKAMRYAWLLPGGGYFYLRRWDTAIGYVFVESLFFPMAIIALYLAVTEQPGLMLGVIVYVSLLTHGRRCAVYGANHFAAEFIPVDMKSLLTRSDLPPERSSALPPSEREEAIEQVLSLRQAGDS